MENIRVFYKNETATIQRYESNMLLQINDKTIEKIPKYFFTLNICERFNRLTLNLDNLKWLGAADLNEFINLETLEIVANNLLEIDENSLNELQKLKNFHLEANNLPWIPNKLFFGLKFLETLQLVVPRANASATGLVTRNQNLISLKLFLIWTTYTSEVV